MKKIIEEFNNLKVKEYGKWRIDRGIARVFLLKALTSQREEFRKEAQEQYGKGQQEGIEYAENKLRKMKRKDFLFLDEMYGYSQSLLRNKYDIVILERLDKMIEDWKDELKELKPRPKRA